MRVAADGFIDVRDGRKVRPPGLHVDTVEPMPEAEALTFLLSHSFPGHRHIVRALQLDERRRLKLAVWADSVSERMTLVDRVWRAISEPVLPPPSTSEPHLIQVARLGGWAYPIYLDGAVTRVLPPGGLPVGELDGRNQPVIELARRTA